MTDRKTWVCRSNKTTKQYQLKQTGMKRPDKVATTHYSAKGK